MLTSVTEVSFPRVGFYLNPHYETRASLCPLPGTKSSRVQAQRRKTTQTLQPSAGLPHATRDCCVLLHRRSHTASAHAQDGGPTVSRCHRSPGCSSSVWCWTESCQVILTRKRSSALAGTLMETTAALLEFFLCHRGDETNSMRGRLGGLVG